MTASRPPRTIDMSAPGIPFTRAVAVELRKLVDTRGPLILLGLAALVWAVILVIALSQSTPMGFAELLEVFGGGSRIFVGVLTIVLVTAEWGQRAVLTVFTLEPRRERVIAAKLGAALLGASALFMSSLALAATATVIRGGSFAGAGAAVRSVGIHGLFDVLLAFAMAIVVLNTAGAVVAYLVLPEIVVPAVLFFGGLIVRDESGDGPTVFDRAADWVSPPRMLKVLDHAMGAQEWAQLLVCTVLWIGLPGLLGVYRVLKAEVK
ncbi:MAG: hypothetical protein QM809_02710 [Gordonia sp. (in: high G+C Gram-positive bacteria)]|uniref:hypothetical protein n=1 Tax=Gordonia sp. (in: high G+C Gram-positive bacteria) TaxID=84139 RepID=UPI0039E457FD